MLLLKIVADFTGPMAKPKLVFTALHVASP